MTDKYLPLNLDETIISPKSSHPPFLDEMAWKAATGG